MFKEKFDIIINSIKIFSAIASLITSLAAIGVIVGYIIIFCFMNTINIYGLTSFVQELPLETLFKAVFDWLRFLGGHKAWSVCFFVIFVLSLFLFTTYATKLLRKLFPFMAGHYIFYAYSFVLLIIVIITIGSYDVRTYAQKNHLIQQTEILLYIFSLPSLIILLIHPFFHFLKLFISSKNVSDAPSTEAIHHDSTSSNIISALLLIVTLIIVPFLYGTVLYDLSIYEIEDISVKKKMGDKIDIISSIQNQKGNYRFLGHSSKKSLIFNLNDRDKLSVAILDNDNIDGLRIFSYLDTNRNETIRQFLYSLASYTPPPSMDKQAGSETVAGKNDEQLELFLDSLFSPSNP